MEPRSLELTTPLITAVQALVKQPPPPAPNREPSHFEISRLVGRCSLTEGDPHGVDSRTGKAHRVMQVLQWAQDNGKHYEGGRLCVELINTIRGHGGFDPNDSNNYVGEDAISRIINAIKGTTHVMRPDGTIEVSMLESTMTNQEREELLSRYIRRAQLGYGDAALVLGTGKDLLECVAKHVCDVAHAPYGEHQPFHQLLIAAWNALSMSIPDGKLDDGTTPYEDQIEHGLFNLGCGINKLRNAEGVGHGRPYPPNITEDEAKQATESMALIASYLLSKLSLRRT